MLEKEICFDTSAISPKAGLIVGYPSEEKLIQNLYPVLEGLNGLENILFWEGLGEDHSYA